MSADPFSLSMSFQIPAIESPPARGTPGVLKNGDTYLRGMVKSFHGAETEYWDSREPMTKYTLNIKVEQRRRDQ
jgi:hypothetical protein